MPFFFKGNATPGNHTYLHTPSPTGAPPILLHASEGAITTTFSQRIGRACCDGEQYRKGSEKFHCLLPRCKNGIPSAAPSRSEEHTSELQSLMRNSYAVFCLKKKTTIYNKVTSQSIHITDSNTTNIIY